MEEEFEDLSEEQVNNLIERFETSIETTQSAYFDVEEFEEIIDYYDLAHNNNKLHIAIETAKNIHPQHISFKLKEAQRLMASKRYINALRILDDIIKIEPTNFLTLQTMAHTYSSMGKHKESIETYKTSIDFTTEK